jgi:predicted transcriptional regulator
VYKFDFDLERVSKEINTLAKLSSSQDKNGVDRREITKIKKRLDALQDILNHIPDLVEKVEDENMDSFTKLKEELDSLRMSVQQQKNGGGIIIERDTSGDRPSDMPQKPRSSIIVGDEATT